MADALISGFRGIVIEFLKTASPEDLIKLNRGIGDIAAKVRDAKARHSPHDPRQDEINSKRLSEIGL